MSVTVKMRNGWGMSVQDGITSYEKRKGKSGSCGIGIRSRK